MNTVEQLVGFVCCLYCRRLVVTHAEKRTVDEPQHPKITNAQTPCNSKMQQQSLEFRRCASHIGGATAKIAYPVVVCFPPQMA